MATSVVETPRIIATLPTRPQDGDDAYMDAGAAPLMPVVQHLYDAAGALRIAALGQMSGGDRLSVDPGGTSTVFTVRISRIVGLLSRQTGSTPIYATYTAGETSLDLTDVDGAPAALANDTWYYVYAFCNGTATTQAYISTVAPEASLTWRTGAEGVDRYVGCFRTNGSGAPLPMRMHRGRYVYWTKQVVASALSTAGVWATQSLSARVPPHVEMVTINAQSSRGSNIGTRAFSLRPGGASASAFDYSALQHNLLGDIEEMRVEMLADSGQDIEYLTNDTTSLLEIAVAGFAE